MSEEFPKIDFWLNVKFGTDMVLSCPVCEWHREYIDGTPLAVFVVAAEKHRAVHEEKR